MMITLMNYKRKGEDMADKRKKTITEKDHSDSSAGNGTTDFHIKMNMKSAE